MTLLLENFFQKICTVQNFIYICLQLNPTKMKNIKLAIAGLSTVAASVYGYGVYLNLNKPYFEDRPEQIAGLECTEYNFEWYNSSISDTVLSTAWDFTPEQSEVITPLIESADTTWFIERNDTLRKVFWAKDITVESESYKDELLRYTVYWSDSL